MFWITFSFDFPEHGCDTSRRSGSVVSSLQLVCVCVCVNAPCDHEYTVSLILIANQRASQDEAQTGRLLRSWPSEIKTTKQIKKKKKKNEACVCCLCNSPKKPELWCWDNRSNLDAPFGCEGFKVAETGHTNSLTWNWHLSSSHFRPAAGLLFQRSQRIHYLNFHVRTRDTTGSEMQMFKQMFFLLTTNQNIQSYFIPL